MNRDMDAIRQIIIAVRDTKSDVTGVEGMPGDVFNFNAMLLIEAGLVLGDTQFSSKKRSAIPMTASIYRLTWKGSDFANLVEDDAIWKKAQKHILRPGRAWTFDFLCDFLKQELQAESRLHGGS